MERRHLLPEYWWMCKIWVSVGQKEVAAEWDFDLLAGIVAADSTEFSAPRPRIDALTRHLRPRL